MRHTLSAIVGVIVIGCCSGTLAEETGSRWWPFGRDKTEAAQPPATPPSAAATTATAPADPAITPVDAAPVQTAPEQVAPQTQPPTDETEAESNGDERWMLSSPKGKVSWPRLHMPALPKPKLPRPDLRAKQPNPHAGRNAWAERPTEERKSPMQAMSNGARKVGNGTRTAWRKTVDVLTPGDSADRDSQVASRDAKPSLWKRMFGPEPEPQGSQTIPEFMAQERLDP